MSWESSLEYYRLLNEGVKERLGGLHSAECVMFSIDFQPVAEWMDRGDWRSISQTLGGAASNLRSAGVDFLIICTNTMHLLAEEIEKVSGLSVLQIGEALARELEKTRLKTVGLLGTRFTMESDYYSRTLEKRGIKTIIPSLRDREVIHTVIFDQLCRGIFTVESRAEYAAIISRLRKAGAEGVILGCTEIPLLIKQSDVEIPIFDTTAIHASAALDRALG